MQFCFYSALKLYSTPAQKLELSLGDRPGTEEKNESIVIIIAFYLDGVER